MRVSLQNLSKSFLVPHQRRTTLKESFVQSMGFFKQTENEKFFALDNINLQVRKGEFLGIIGATGSGKSTSLKILAGIYRPDQGQVIVNGTVAPLLELGIGFQQDLSARDNIFINAALLGISSTKIKKILPEIVQFAEIGHFLDLKVKNYSSGMRQRLAFAIAAYLDADIYLCDEIFAVGDEKFQTKCIEVFQRWRDQGKTIILVSHNTGQIADLCDRAVLFNQGKILADGYPQEVISVYQKANLTNEITPSIPDYSESPLRITDLEIFNSAGQLTGNFQTGADLHLRIHFQAREIIRQPVFGLAIHRQDGTHVTGPNTKTSGFHIETIYPGKGFIECNFPSINLLGGMYHLTVSAFDYTCLHAFDYLDKRFSFIVENNRDNQYGLIDLSVNWHLGSTNDT